MCRNRGDCRDSINGPKCACYQPFDGPNCEKQSIEFAKNDAWMWLPPLQTCAKSVLSFEFKTQLANCLIFYNGPMTKADSLTIPDFVSLELKSGLPRFLIDTGAGPAELIVPVNESLNDGKLHTVIVYWVNGDINMVVDHCTFHDPCENSVMMPGTNRYLNVNMPLQLGRIKWMESFTLTFGSNSSISPPDFRNGFIGYIGKLKFNDFVYDMSQAPQTQELLVDFEETNFIEKPELMDESMKMKIQIASVIISVVFLLICFILVWKNLLKKKLAKLKKKQERQEQNLGQDFITRLPVNNEEMKDAIERLSKIRPDNNTGRIKRKKEQFVTFSGVSEEVSISPPLSTVSDHRAHNKGKPFQDVAPLDLSKKLDTIEPDYHGPVDHMVTYSEEGGDTPETSSLSTITAFETCSQQGAMVDPFLNKYVVYESSGSTIHGTENYL